MLDVCGLPILQEAGAALVTLPRSLVAMWLKTLPLGVADERRTRLLWLDCRSENV